MKYSYVFDVWIEVREIPWYSRLFDPCIGKDRFIDRSKFFFFVLFGLYYSYLTIFLIIFYNFHMEFEFFSGFSFSFEVWKRKCGNLIRFYYPCCILSYLILFYSSRFKFYFGCLIQIYNTERTSVYYFKRAMKFPIIIPFLRSVNSPPTFLHDSSNSYICINYLYYSSRN